MNDYELNKWMLAKGFVPNGRGGYHKPKRAVHAVHQKARPEPEPVVSEESPRPAHRETTYPGRVHISITSYCCGTQRDSDNICPKYFIDCLRYAGLIRDDCPGAIELIVKEERVSKKQKEGCLIVITPL